MKSRLPAIKAEWALTKIQNAILTSIDNGKGKWQDIVTAVKLDVPRTRKEDFNWLKVRGDVQGMINAGMIKRTDSVMVEEYIWV